MPLYPFSGEGSPTKIDKKEKRAPTYSTLSTGGPCCDGPGVFFGESEVSEKYWAKLSTSRCFQERPHAPGPLLEVGGRGGTLSGVGAHCPFWKRAAVGGVDGVGGSFARLWGGLRSLCGLECFASCCQYIARTHVLLLI